MLINKICDSVDSDSRNVSEMSDKELYARALDLQSILEGELSEEDRSKYEKEDYDLVSEIVRRRRIKDGKVSDSLDDMIAELEAIPWWATDEVTEQVKKIVAQNGTKTIKKDGKEILTFAESQSGTPMYSYKQHAWTPFDKVQDGGVTHMSDIGSNCPGKFGDSFDIGSAVKIEIPEDSIDKAIVKLVKAGIRAALQDKTIYAESSREDAEKALEGIQYKIADSSDLSKFKVKLRDVEEVRKRFKDAGIPLYWSGRFLYADAPETKVDEILGDIDHTFFLTLSGGDGMMWIKIPDDKQRHDAMVKLIVAGLQTHAAGDRLLVREDRDKVEELLKGMDFQIMDSVKEGVFDVKVLDSDEYVRVKTWIPNDPVVLDKLRKERMEFFQSGPFLYVNAPRDTVERTLIGLGVRVGGTRIYGRGPLQSDITTTVSIPDDDQRRKAIRKLVSQGILPKYGGNILIIGDDPEGVKDLLKEFDYQIVDSAQADKMSYSWEEFADKVGSDEDATAYSDHVVVSGDKAYRIQITEEVNDALPALAVAALTPIAAKVGEKVAEKLGDSIWGTKDEACQFATRESANKTLSACKLQDSATVVKSPKGFFKIVDHSGRSYKGSKVCDCWILSKQELLEKRPSWVADSAIWERAVDRLTRESGEYANAKSVMMLYKRLGGTRKVKDSFIRDIQVGDTLRIVRGDHVGEFGEVLAVNPDGSFNLKNLVTGEEFTEPETLFGLHVNVEDSENGPKIEDAMDAPSLKRALSVILETEDPANRKRSVTSKVATFLNYYDLGVEVEPEDNTIWLSDDDTKLKVDENKIWIMRPDEKPESYGLLDDIELWFARVKELSAPATEA